MAEPILSEEKHKDRFWWLPILLALSAPWWWLLPVQTIYAASQTSNTGSFGDSGPTVQSLCPAVLFSLSASGFLSLFGVITLPALVTLWVRLNRKNTALLCLTIAYVCTAIVGLMGATRDFSAATADAAATVAHHPFAAIAPCIAMLALILGWRKKKILLRSLLAATLSSLFIIIPAELAIALGGSGNS